jgi:long-chain acyl-CoA synthetase
MGITACDTAEWLAHKGTVGRQLFGEIHIHDINMSPCTPGTIGDVWFDAERTKQVLSTDGTMGTVGDVGYLALKYWKREATTKMDFCT